MGANKNILEVQGMTCATCALSVEKTLGKQKGVEAAIVNLADSSVNLSFDQQLNTFTALKKSLKDVGYTLIIPSDDAAEEIEYSEQNRAEKQLKKTVITAALSIAVMLIGMGFPSWAYTPYALFLLTSIVLFAFGFSYFKNAFGQIKNRMVGMDTLVALSTGIAYTFSVFNTFNPSYWTNKGLTPYLYYEAAVMILTFVMLGKYLEDRAKAKTGSALAKLKDRQADSVLIYRDGEEVEVSINEVKNGDLIIVKPGSMIPVDGKVAKGESYVDESMITGEPIPSAKHQNSSVYSGTINQNGHLEILTEAVSEGTLLAKIIQRVREAQGSKAPVQKLVDKVASVFVPIVIALAIITFIVWYFSGVDESLSQALITSISVLVIACPCALGLATPTALMVGMGKSAESQILIKDAESLERALHITDIVLDKTGTVTVGKPELESIVWTEGSESKFHISILHAIEQKSEHPLASAVVNALESDELLEIPLTRFESVTGKGIIADYVGISYKVGNLKWMQEHNVPIQDNQLLALKEASQIGKTVLFFGGHEKLIALLTVSDTLKENVIEDIKILLGKNIECHLYSGDSSETTSYVASQLGINSWKGSLLPEEKGIFIDALRREGKVVAMVGDGINDSEALAKADVSIAMGKGSDIAIDAAQITLLAPNLALILKAISISRLTMNTIRTNLFWAFIYNIIGIPIAAGVLYIKFDFLISPMIAAAAMAFSSISVVLNSLYLKRRIDRANRRAG
jgi:P-type Cu2+ transporter